MFRLLLLASLGWTAPADPPVAVPDWLPKAVKDVDRAMASVESGRRLQASSLDVPVEPAALPPGGPAVLFLPGERPSIAVDPERARALTAVEFELAMARERSRAARDAGVRLIEAEQAAEQAVLEYVLDRAATSEEFGGRLSRAAKRLASGPGAGEEVEGPGPVFEPRLPARDPDREAELLVRFSKDPDRFYWAVERELIHAAGAVRLIELESFLWSYAERLERSDCPARAHYCRLDGRLVRPELVRAAKATLAGGGLDRLREGLGGFQGDEAESLRKKVQAWLKGL